MSSRTTCLLSALLSLAALPASAQYIGSGGSSSAVQYSPQGKFNQQPLTTNRQDVAVFVGPLANPKFGTAEEAGISAVRLPLGLLGGLFGTETFWFFQAGAAYGIARGFEAGVFTPPLLFSPDTEAGDLPIFFTWASSVEDVDIGLRTTFTIPLREESPWRLNPGVHALIRFDTGRLDLGAFFPIAFFDSDVAASLEIPFRLSFETMDSLFVGLETGLRKLDLTGGSNDLFLPLGPHALYSLEAGQHRVDIGARLHWQAFAWLNAPEGVSDRIFEDAYVISFGANVLLDTTPSKSR